jgi:hypothetical protein
LNLLKQRVDQDNGVAVYFDCSQYHHQKWNSFLHQIVIEVQKNYKREQMDETVTLPCDFELPTASSRYAEAKAIKSFEEDITELYNQLGRTRILLIFDEIENISFATSPSEHWCQGKDALYFWQALRSIIQTNNNLLSFIVTGVNPKCVEISQINGFDNPIFGILRPQYITLFDLPDVKNMVSGIGGHLGLSFEEEIYTKLVDDYGGHPFLTRQVCSRINNDLLLKGIPRPYTITKYSYEMHTEDYRLEMAGVIEQILGVLETYYPKEYELLKKLAIDGRSAFKKEIGQGGETAILHLLGYCLIKKEEEEYFISIKSIEKYLKDKYRNDQTLTSQADKRLRISMRRNELEIKLRNIIFYNLHSKYGKKARERLVDYVNGTTLDKGQEKKVQNVRLKEAMQELFFPQLKIVVLKDWKDYQIIFQDRVKFEQFFDVINSFRPTEAHAKSIDEEDEALLNVAFKFFEKALKEYDEIM